jgi:hypothetical protein
MLHAIEQRKATAFFLKIAREETLRQPFEDMITSTIFGPLDMMPREMAAKGLTRILGLDAEGIRIEAATLIFWPWVTGDENRYRQPDIMVKGDGPNGRKIELRIEVKWDARFYPGQLLEQRAHIPVDGCDAYQVAVVRNAATALVELRDLEGKPEGWNPIIRSWREIAAFAGQKSIFTDPLQRWLNLVHKFLTELGEIPFTDFSMVEPLIVEAGLEWQKFQVSQPCL